MVLGFSKINLEVWQIHLSQTRFAVKVICMNYSKVYVIHYWKCFFTFSVSLFAKNIVHIFVVSKIGRCDFHGKSLSLNISLA